MAPKEGAGKRTEPTSIPATLSLLDLLHFRFLSRPIIEACQAEEAPKERRSVRIGDWAPGTVTSDGILTEHSLACA
jgi:hypothetical protein